MSWFDDCNVHRKQKIALNRHRPTTSHRLGFRKMWKIRPRWPQHCSPTQSYKPIEGLVAQFCMSMYDSLGHANIHMFSNMLTPCLMWRFTILGKTRLRPIHTCSYNSLLGLRLSQFLLSWNTTLLLGLPEWSFLPQGLCSLGPSGPGFFSYSMTRRHSSILIALSQYVSPSFCPGQ